MSEPSRPPVRGGAGWFSPGICEEKMPRDARAASVRVCLVNVRSLYSRA